MGLVLKFVSAGMTFSCSVCDRICREAGEKRVRERVNGRHLPLFLFFLQKKSIDDPLMKNSCLFACLMLLCSISISQTIPPDSLYFGQTPPGNTPQLFAPGIVSLPGRNEAVITFSPDGSTVFFYIQKYPQPGTPFIMSTTYSAHWPSPDTVPFAAGRSTAEPFLAYNGTRLYMYATNAVNHEGIADLSYSLLQNGVWGDPVSMGDPPNSDSYQYHPCIVGDSSVYFSSNAGHVCRSQYINGLYQSRVILPRPVNYIGSPTWGDPYVAPDESYMVIKAIRDGGFGQNDLYIAYRKTDGSWTNPKNLGDVINTPYDETSGDITPDGLYMTYGSNEDLYWVGTVFIDSLKYTNYVPYLKNPIPNQTACVEQFYSYTIPDSTFFDDDGNNTLSFSAGLTNGDPLPSWLTFDSLSCTFHGTPVGVGVLNIKVTATDTAGANTFGNLKLVINLPSLVEPMSAAGITVSPNPGNGLFRIHLGENLTNAEKFEVSDLCGRVILSAPATGSGILDLTNRARGWYVIKIFAGKQIFSGLIGVE
jgi:hypothetical protein